MFSKGTGAGDAVYGYARIVAGGIDYGANIVPILPILMVYPLFHIYFGQGNESDC